MEVVIAWIKMVLLQWVFAGYINFWSWAWDYTRHNPAHALMLWSSLFFLTFLAYGTLRRMWEDGSFGELHFAQQFVILFAVLSPPLSPLLFGYLFDIFVMRCLVGSIMFGVAPWHQDWRFLSSSWTFSRLISLFEFDTGWRGPRARFWRPILHAIDPHGH